MSVAPEGSTLPFPYSVTMLFMISKHPGLRFKASDKHLKLGVSVTQTQASRQGRPS